MERLNLEQRKYGAEINICSLSLDLLVQSRKQTTAATVCAILYLPFSTNQKEPIQRSFCAKNPNQLGEENGDPS